LLISAFRNKTSSKDETEKIIQGWLKLNLFLGEARFFIRNYLIGPVLFPNELFMQKMHHVKIQRQQRPRLREGVMSWQTCKVQDKFRKISHFKSLSFCELT